MSLFLNAMFCLLTLSLSQQVFALGIVGKQVAVPKGSLENPTPMGFQLYLPQNYSAATAAGHPLILFMHGIGEKGDGTTQLGKVNLLGLAKRLNSGFHLPAIVVSPQCCGPTYGWTASELKQVVDYIKSKLNVDDDRFYVTGLSWGGEGTIKYARMFPNDVAAIVPIAQSRAPFYEQDVKLKGIPTWAFHSNRDPNGGSHIREIIGILNNVTTETASIMTGYPYPVAPADFTLVKSSMTAHYSESKMTHTWMEGSTSKVIDPDNTIKFTIYASTSHDAWTKAYNNTDMYNWLLLQNKKGVDTSINNAPTFASVAAQTMEENQSKTLTLTATDADGDPLALRIVSGLPIFGSFADLGAGKGSLALNPGAGKAGSYSIKVEAKDPEGAIALVTVSLTVKAPVIPIKAEIDFGSSSYPTVGGINVSSQGTFYPVIDKSGIMVGDIKISGFNAVNKNGTTTPTAPGILAAMSRDSFYGNTAPVSGVSAPEGLIKLTGLDPARTYKLSIFASRIGVTSNRQTQYSVSGSTTVVVNLDVHNNTSKLAVASVKPSAAGEISIIVKKGALNNDSFGYFYLGAMIIE